jgi:hypothetical protein
MRRLLALAAILALAVSCASRPTATGGLQGTVLAGPTCPVETPGAQCDPRPWVGTVRATAKDGTAYETKTDDLGRYAIDLPPGTYTVVAATDGGGPPSGIPQAVSVADGQPVHLDLEVDTGIR